MCISLKLPSTELHEVLLIKLKKYNIKKVIILCFTQLAVYDFSRLHLSIISRPKLQKKKTKETKKLHQTTAPSTFAIL